MMRGPSRGLVFSTMRLVLASLTAKWSMGHTTDRYRNESVGMRSIPWSSNVAKLLSATLDLEM